MIHVRMLPLILRCDPYHNPPSADGADGARWDETAHRYQWNGFHVSTYKRFDCPHDSHLQTYRNWFS